MNEIIQSFERKEQSFDINQTIKRYPFHGCSKYLIDKFLIIGYDKMVFDKVIQPSHKASLNQKNDSSRNSFNPLTNAYSFPINTEPSIINEICSDYSKELLDNEIITSLVFPNKPVGYYFDSERSKEEAKKNQAQQNYSVIFNSNPSSNVGLKKSYNGIAYIVFEKFHIPSKNEIYKIPKAFCILSEFPFYSSFYKLLQIVSAKFKHPGNIPVEVFVHNIVCYTPSPINQNIKLLIPIKQKQDDLSALSSSMSSKKAKISDLNNINSNIEKLTFPLVNGFPIVEYSLPKIFLYLGPQLAFKTFFFSFLEKDILVFSSNHELLSLVIFTFHSLNYPLNDGNYYWQNVSVSYQDLLSENGPFVNQSYPVMLGVHSKYNDSYSGKSKTGEHFVLDLDNKTFTFVYQKETEEVKNLNYLLNFINKIVKNSSSKHNKVLYAPCKKLYTFLESEKVPKNVNVNHFYDDVDRSVNLKYQEEFYKFILGVVGLVYKNITLHSEMDSKTNQHDRNRLKESFYNEYSNEYESYLPDEKFFFEQLKGTFKFSSFIEGYVKSHNDNGLYQIPFLFLDEFANMQIKWIDKESNVNFTFLKYIQDIYSHTPSTKSNNPTPKGEDNDEHKTQTILVTSPEEIIDCNNFLNFYINSFSYEFYREIVDPPSKNKCLSIANNFSTSRLYPESTSLYSSEIFGEITKKVEYKYEQLKLHETFLYKYKKKLRDLPQLYFQENFPWYDIIDKGNELAEINVNYLENVAETIYIETNKTIFNHLIKHSLFLMFALTRPLASSEELTEQIYPFSEFLDSYVSSRKYFKELLFIFKHLSTQDDEEKTKSIKGCVSLVINKLRVKGIVSSFLLTKLINDVNESTDEAGFFDVDVESTDVKPQLSFNLSPKGMISDKEYIEYLKRDCSKIGTLSNREIVEEKESKRSKDSSSTKKSLSPKLTYPFMKTDLKNQDMPLTTPKKIFLDLFRLKNKLLYNFEDKNEEIINNTITLIQYCVCLMFYVQASGILGECITSSMKFLLHKIIIMLENKIESTKEQPTPY